jgi:hypothetical protein
MKNIGISLGSGVYGIQVYIPHKGFILWYNLTKEDIKELKNGK